MSPWGFLHTRFLLCPFEENSVLLPICFPCWPDLSVLLRLLITALLPNPSLSHWVCRDLNCFLPILANSPHLPFLVSLPCSLCALSSGSQSPCQVPFPGSVLIHISFSGFCRASSRPPMKTLLHTLLIRSIFLPFPLSRSQAPLAKWLLVPQLSLALSQCLSFFLSLLLIHNSISLLAFSHLLWTVLVYPFSLTTPSKPQALCALSSAGLHYSLLTVMELYQLLIWFCAFHFWMLCDNVWLSESWQN